VAKGEAEESVPECCRSATCLRLATVFGPGETGPRAIPSFIRALARGERPVVHGDGDDIRDYVYVDDVAMGFLSAATIPGLAPIYNVGSGEGRSTISVLRAVAAVMERPASALHVPAKRP